MSIREKINNAQIGTNWLTEGIPEVELKQNMDLGNLSYAIESRRIEMGLNQKKFSELLGVTQGMVSKYESGEYNFTIGTLNRICELIGLKFEPHIYSPNDVKNNIFIIKRSEQQDLSRDCYPENLEAIA